MGNTINPKGRDLARFGESRWISLQQSSDLFEDVLLVVKKEMARLE